MWLIGEMDPITNWIICGVSINVYISIKTPEWRVSQMAKVVAYEVRISLSRSITLFQS